VQIKVVWHLILTLSLTCLYISCGRANCVYGDCQNGSGEFQSGNNKYIGQFQGGKRHGYGINVEIRSKYERLVYFGGWRAGIREGDGIILIKKDEGQVLIFAKMEKNHIKNNSLIVMRYINGVEGVYSAKTDYKTGNTDTVLQEELTDKYRCLFGNSYSRSVCYDMLIQAGINEILDTTFVDLITSRGLGSFLRKKLRKSAVNAGQELMTDISSTFEVGKLAIDSRALMRSLGDICDVEFRICPH
jgi:hypothetical protein